MVTDKLYCVDLLAKLLDSSLTCDIISSPNSTVNLVPFQLLRREAMPKPEKSLYVLLKIAPFF